MKSKSSFLLSLSLLCAFFGGVAVWQASTLAHSQSITPCQPPTTVGGDATLLKMRDSTPQDLPGMHAHAWSIFANKLWIPSQIGEITPASGHFRWEYWCVVTNEAGRTLLCPSAQDLQMLHTLSLYDSDPKHDLDKARIEQLLGRHWRLRFFDGLGIPRQLSAAVQNRESPTKVLTKTLAGSNPRPLIFQTSEVFFSPESGDLIRSCFGDGPLQVVTAANGSGDWGTKMHLGPPKEGCLAKTPIQSTSIAIKTVWAVTTYSGNDWPDSDDPHRVTLSNAIPLWDESLVQQVSGFPAAPRLDQWRVSLPVGLTVAGNQETSPCSSSTQYTPNLERIRRVPSQPYVPINCFYSIRVTSDEWNQLISDANAKTLLARRNRGAQSDIYFILLGFHVTTKEIPNWTWQTFWWNPLASNNPALPCPDPISPCSDPASPYQKAPGTAGAIDDPMWSHYSVLTTYGPPAYPAMNYRPQAAFDPYLEAASLNGIESNCATCHNYAFYHNGSQSEIAKEFHNGNSLGLGTCTPNGCSEQAAAAFCENGKRTDFLWSLAADNVIFNRTAASGFTEDSGHLSSLSRFLQRLDTESELALRKRDRKARPIR